MGWRKRIQSRYCKLRSQGTRRETSEVFHRGEKEGWFRPRARQFAGNDSVPGPSLKEVGIMLEGKARFLREQGYGKRPRAWKALTTEDEELLWLVQRARWQPISEVPNSHNVVCFDAAFRITRLPGAPRHVCRRFFIQQRRQWRRVHHIRRKSHKNASGRASQKKKSGSAENACNWWAKMSSQASEDVSVIQTCGNENQWAILPRGDWAPEVSSVV